MSSVHLSAGGGREGCKSRNWRTALKEHIRSVFELQNPLVVGYSGTGKVADVDAPTVGPLGGGKSTQ